MSGKKKKNWYTELFKKNSVSIILATLGTLGAVYNLYLAYQLTPLIQNINNLAGRVEAMESYRNENRPYIERFVQVESLIQPMQGDIQEIKDDVKSIKNYLISQ